MKTAPKVSSTWMRGKLAAIESADGGGREGMVTQSSFMGSDNTNADPEMTIAYNQEEEGHTMNMSNITHKHFW